MEKIKIRIALEIDPDGDWYAYGDANGGEFEEVIRAIEFGALNPGGSRYWIEAEIPVPDANIETVKGDAVPA